MNVFDVLLPVQLTLSYSIPYLLTQVNGRKVIMIGSPFLFSYFHRRPAVIVIRRFTLIGKGHHDDLSFVVNSFYMPDDAFQGPRLRKTIRAVYPIVDSSLHKHQVHASGIQQILLYPKGMRETAQ